MPRRGPEARRSYRNGLGDAASARLVPERVNGTDTGPGKNANGADSVEKRKPKARLRGGAH